MTRFPLSSPRSPTCFTSASGAIFFAPDTTVGWPLPAFRLHYLTVEPHAGLRSDSRPGSAELAWLTASSRESLRHLDLDGFTPDVASHLQSWGGQLRTIRLGLLYWADRPLVEQAAGLARLCSLRRLTLMERPQDTAEDDQFAQDEGDAFEGWLAQAVARVNRELGRQVARVEF